MDRNELLAWMADDISLSLSEVSQMVSSAPFRYKHYRLIKKSGGYRDIYHPSPELKAIQKWIVRNILDELDIHDAVRSYRRGMSIRDNAEAHLGSRYFLRLDFTDFFPSIHFDDVVGFLRGADALTEFDLDVTAVNTLGVFLCRAPKGQKLNRANLALSIGAPSSPSVSNAILFSLDEKIHAAANLSGANYTRYADDMYFSTVQPDVLSDLADVVRELITRHESPRLTINEGKTSFVSRKQRVQVTGLILKPDGGISVGRKRKRHVRGQVHKFLNGQLDASGASSLRGMLAYIRSVEPEFIERLAAKYGADAIATLLT